MKIYNAIIIFLSLTFFSCKGQQKLKSKKMRTFNIQKFEKNISLRENKTSEVIAKDFRSTSFKYQEAKNVIELGQQGDGAYREEVKKINSVYKTVYIYYEDTCTLKYESVFFQTTPIGISKTYSKEGSLIDEIDNDKTAKEHGILTRQEMVEIMKVKFDIDISKEDELDFISFHENGGNYIWKVICKAHPERNIDFVYAYIFNAKTGEFIKKEVFTTEG